MAQRMTRVHRVEITAKPWNCLDAEISDEKYSPIHFPEEQEVIDFCLNCPLPENRCKGTGNCYLMRTDVDGVPKPKIRKKSGKFDEGLFLRLHRDGLTRQQIATRMNVTVRTVRAWNQRLGIPND